MHIFLTGGSGLVGSRLVAALLARGDTPVVLTRNVRKAQEKIGPGVEFIEGDPGQPGPWMDALAPCDAVVNLVGAGVFDRRWSPQYKKILVESRTRTTANVVEALNQSPRRADGTPKVLLSASAIGYYGPHGEEELDEDAPPASDFMGKLCVDWEAAANAATEAGIRVVLVRVGIVLDKAGGALAQLLPPFKMAVGGPVATGRQYMSWIHHEDLVRMFLWAMDSPQVSGPLNGTAPNPVTNKAFGHALGRVLGRPAVVWTPGFALFLLFGEAAAIVVQGQRVIPRRAMQLGFTFQYPELVPALEHLLK
jgi:uncharacterized protein (TIGR01777 family)